MTTTTVHTERIDGKLIGLPVDIQQPDIKAALDKLIDLSAARKVAIETRDKAGERLRNALTAEADDIAQAIMLDTSFEPEGVAPTTLAAQEVARTAQIKLDGINAARRLAVADLDSAIEAHGASWGKGMRERALSAVLTVTTALDMAETAKAELDAAVGVLLMLKGRQDENNPAVALALGGGRYVLPLDTAIGALRAALVEASREVDKL